MQCVFFDRDASLMISFRYDGLFKIGIEKLLNMSSSCVHASSELIFGSHSPDVIGERNNFFVLQPCYPLLVSQRVSFSRQATYPYGYSVLGGEILSKGKEARDR